MDIGRMRQVIRVQSRSTSENSLGEDIGAWSDMFSTWASADPIRGREYFAASQAQATIDVKFTVRYRTGIDETMRVVWNGDVYEIVSPPINVGGMRRTLELMCTKGLSVEVHVGDSIMLIDADGNLVVDVNGNIPVMT